MIKVNIVTTNEGKAREFIRLGEIHGVKVNVLRFPKLEVQSSELEDVALMAAITAYTQLNTPLAVEDAGLFIEYLRGFPGVYSSFVLRTIGVKGILKLMEGVDDRRAYFKSVIAYIDLSNSIIKLFTGITRGIIATEARGTSGFGFDPIFIPEGSNKTYAEMSIDEKNAVSHRAKAFRKLVEWLKNSF